MNIYQTINEIMKEIEAIPKDKKNTMQGYSFRGIDDIYLAIHNLMAKHGLVTVPTVIDDKVEERTTSKGSALIYRVLKIQYDFYAVDGSKITAVVIGEGMDSGDKASNKAMAVAHKYALLQVFCIPTTENKDPEHDSHEIIPRGTEALLNEIRDKAKKKDKVILIQEYMKKEFNKTALPQLTSTELSMVMDLLDA